MDPATAAADIADRLSASFSGGRHQGQLPGRIQGADRGPGRVGRGIITSVDDITVLAGTGKLISVNDIIGNDRNTGEGDLRLVSIGPSKVTFTEVQNVMTARMSELESETAPTAMRSRLIPQVSR